MKVCLLGGRGQLGPWVVKELERCSDYSLRITDVKPPDRSPHETMTGDVSDLDQVRRAAEGCDVIVNCAGGARPIPWDAPDDAWHEGMTLNFEALRRLTLKFIPKMRDQQWGRIINITGTSEPEAVNIASSAKAAVHAWAKGLSRVLAADGITVNCLPPGRIKSEQILNKVHPDPAERQAFVKANIPAGYLGEPEDMACLIAFLASPLARYITGEVIHVDGGMRRFAF